MEKLKGHGLRDDAIGVMQVGETVTEILVNGWWIISVEDCMTNDHGHGYYLELLVNHRQLSLEETGFMTIDDTVDGLFVYSWSHALAVLTLNLDHFKDRVPSCQYCGQDCDTGCDEAQAGGFDDACGWCGSMTYPHICLGSVTELISTANASAPKPPAVTQEEQDKLDMAKATVACNCGSTSFDWRHHARMAAEEEQCIFYREGERIQRRKDRIQRWRDRSWVR